MRTRIQTLSSCLYLLAAGLPLNFLGGEPAAQPPKLKATYPAVLTKRLTDSPNILLILADEIGSGDVGAFGQRRIRTPNLDRFVAEGFAFNQFYAAGSRESETQAALLTGRNPAAVLQGPDDGVMVLKPGVPGLPHALKSLDGNSAYLGEWLLGDAEVSQLPHRYGFGDWLGTVRKGGEPSYFPSHLMRNDGLIALGQTGGGQGTVYAPDWTARAALNFINSNRTNAFLLVAAFPGAHPGRINGTNHFPVPSDVPYSNEPWPVAERNRAAMITRFDDQVGLILKGLQETKLDAVTIVWVVGLGAPSDETGFGSTLGLRGRKGDLYEGGLRVPSIIRWPGHLAAGKSYDGPAGVMDVLPTVSQLAGITRKLMTDGVSLAPLMTGRPQPDLNRVLTWTGRGVSAIREGDWKLVRVAAASKSELYNLKIDPVEKTNVAGSQPELVRRLERLLQPK